MAEITDRESLSVSINLSVTTPQLEFIRQCVAESGMTAKEYISMVVLGLKKVKLPDHLTANLNSKKDDFLRFRMRADIQKVVRERAKSKNQAVNKYIWLKLMGLD